MEIEVQCAVKDIRKLEDSTEERKKEGLIVKIKLRHGLANGPFPSGFVFKIFISFFFFPHMCFFLSL